MITRRGFIKNGAMASVAASVNPANVLQTDIKVTEFGADPSGQMDSTAAIQAAFQAASQNSVRRIVFTNGTYQLATASHSAINLIGKNGLEVEGGASKIVMGVDAVAITLDKCSNVTFRDLSIDWNPPRYVQGQVTGSGVGWCEIMVDPRFAVPSIPGILSADAYDRSLRGVSPHTVSIQGTSITSATFVRPGILRLAYGPMTKVPVGTILVVRFQGSHDAVRVTHCDNVTFANVRLLSSPMMGFNISNSRDLQFRTIHIGFDFESSRLLSTIADGMHITNCSGQLLIQNSIFQGMGDDAININSAMWRAHQARAATSAVLYKRTGAFATPEDVPKGGEDVEVLDPRDLHVISRSRTDSSSVPEGAIVTIANRIPKTEISTCKFFGNRARAIVGHANIRIENNIFQNTSLAAIIIAPDSYWLEGPVTEDVVINSNTFSGCHYASDALEGTVAVDVEHTASRRVGVPNGAAHNVTITNNIFRQTYTAALSCRSVDGLVVQGNQIGAVWNGQSGRPAILLEQITNGTVTHNSANPRSIMSVKQSVNTAVSDNPGFLVS